METPCVRVRPQSSRSVTPRRLQTSSTSASKSRTRREATTALVDVIGSPPQDYGLRLVVRDFAFAAARSAASLRRKLLPSMEMSSARCRSRSTRVTTQAALGKTCDHSEKGLFVLRTIDRDASYRRVTT